MVWLLSVVWMTALQAPGTIVDRIAASVDDVAIPESEVRKAMALSILRPERGESPADFRGRVLDALIDERLSYEDARRFGPAAPDASEVDAAIAKIRARLEKEGRDPDKEFAAAGMTREDVRASVQRQIVIQKYLAERFRPIALADEDRAKEEYEKFYLPEQKAAGRPAEPFEKVADEMRRRSQQRVFDDEVEKWLKDLREKARITVYAVSASVPANLTPIPLSTAVPAPTPTPAHPG